MSEEKGMTQADWTAELLKDADYIELSKHYFLYKTNPRGLWKVCENGGVKPLFARGFKHPADAYQKLMELLAK